jgi:hypothetical protein
MRPNGARDLYAGPENGPEEPFPIKLSGPVIKGFGRGSREVSSTISTCLSCGKVFFRPMLLLPVVLRKWL